MTSDTLNERSVGIIGVGQMGRRIAERAVETGLEITGYDSDPSRLEGSTIVPADSMAELVGSCDVILLSLPSSAVVEEVVEGSGDLLSLVRAGQVIIDLSTSDPRSTARLSSKFSEVGVSLIDSGISGGAAAAEKGTLTLMIGGDEQVTEDLEWLLSRISEKTFYMGPSGQGHMAKLLNNYLNAVSLVATSEVMVAARMAGLDLERFLTVLNASSGVNFATLQRFPKIINGDYLKGGLTGRLMAKDVLLYLDTAHGLNAPTLSGPAIYGAIEMGNASGYGDEISNRIVDAIGDLAGGVRVHDGEDPEE